MGSVPTHADRVRAAIASGAAARSLLAASWQRCADVHRLDPDEAPEPRMLSKAELRRLSEPVEPLLHAALPTLERLHAAMRGSRACLLFAGADGIPLRWSGLAGDAADLRRQGLWTGVDWSEATGGTNGIGTSLVEKRPLLVRHDQHFYVRALEITCASAPVFDHEGQLAGAVNVTFYGAASARAPAGLLLAGIADAARQIEIDHFHRRFEHARILSLPGSTRAGTVLLAVDGDDVILGASRGARQIFGLTPAALRQGLVAGDLLGAGEDGFDSAELGVLRRALLRSGGNVTATAKRLKISRATIKRKLRQHRLGRRG